MSEQPPGPSETVGRFRILHRLGKGGMGDVFLAYDEKLDRKVALKRIRADRRPDAETKSRFLREARLLSQLKHPNICQIFDYIEGADADFLALEFIQGPVLSDVIQNGPSWKLKLRIASEIAAALVAAHEKGIVHRDLKPSNVMLADGEQVKVLDFGLSRALRDGFDLPGISVATVEQGASPNAAKADGEETLVLPGAASRDRDPDSASVTAVGSVVGTPGYMSPEQARGEDVTTASDLYSFGVLLQELFTGAPPFDRGLPAEIILLKAQEGETTPVRGLPPEFSILINRLKAQAPAARPSAVDAEERLAWIREKPSRQRRKALFGVAVAILAFFSAAMSVLTVREAKARTAAREAEAAAKREAARANHEAEASRQVSDFLVGLFKVSDPGEARGNAVTARQLLDAASAKIDGQLQDQPELRARLLQTMGTVYWALGLYRQAEDLLRTALSLREQVLGPGHLDVAQTLGTLGRLCRDEGKYGEAAALISRALVIRERMLGPHHPDVSKSLNGLAVVYADLGRFEEAEPLQKRALAILEENPSTEPLDIAKILSNFGNLYRVENKLAEAEPLLKRALVIEEKALGPDHPDVASSLNDVAVISQDLGRLDDAVELYLRAISIWEKTLGKDHPSVATALNNLGSAYLDQGRYVEAARCLERSITISQKALGPNHPDVAMTLCNLACIAAKRGRKAEALGYLRRALPGGGGTPWMNAIETEDDFLSLRGTREFERIVAEVKRRSKERKEGSGDQESGTTGSGSEPPSGK